MARLATSISVLCISLSVSLVGVAGAQRRSPGDVDPQGRVLTRIKVTVAAPGEYERPVSGVSMFVVAERGQPVPVTTDDAGIAAAWLAPATYRLVTRAPVVFQNTSYAWDLLISVKRGIPLISLTTGNATAVVALAQAGARAVGDRQPQGPKKTPGSPAPKNVTMDRNFWINLGLGFGSLGCGICDGYLGGLTAGLSAGGSVNSQVLIGVGANGWTKSASGENLSGGTFAALVKLYPIRTKSVFVTGGAGLGVVNSGLSYSGTSTETGLGALVGIGMDLRIASGLSLTPFWNGFGVKTSESNVRVSQVGLGITVR